MARPRAGDFTELVAFDKQGSTPDGYGGTTTAWVEQFQVRASYVHLRGGEAVQAARLTGQHVQAVRVRSSAAMRTVTTDWRVRDVRTGAVFNVRDIEPDLSRLTIDFLCQKGVAA